MNPLRLFDYVFYCIADLYDYVFGYEEQKELSAALFLGLFQGFNVLTILGYTKPLKSFKNPVIIYIGAILFFIIFNLIRYYKFTKYDNLESIWGTDYGIKKVIKVLGVICYIVLTIVIFVKTGNLNFNR